MTHDSSEPAGSRVDGVPSRLRPTLPAWAIVALERKGWLALIHLALMAQTNWQALLTLATEEKFARK